jgi:hypothetical protein
MTLAIPLLFWSLLSEDDRAASDGMRDTIAEI